MHASQPHIFRPHVAVIVLLFGAILGTLGAATQAPAAQDGIADPAFQAALTLWLDDNEKDALPELARLTRQGNQAALVLLAMIDKTVELQGPWLGLLSGVKRSALMRAPGGFSGLSWLNFQPDSIFAATWLQVWLAQSDVASALAFSALDENPAARRALMFLEARQGTGFAEARDHPGYPREMLYLVWRQWRFAGGKEAKIAAGLARLAAGDPQRLMMGQKIDSQELENWLITASPARQMHSMCRAMCPHTVRRCARAAFVTIGGYGRLMSLGSPTVAVIPETRFIQSRRAHMTIIRAVLLSEQLTQHRLARIAGIDACFAALVDDESQNF